jgi:hypothetical protein
MKEVVSVTAAVDTELRRDCDGGGKEEDCIEGVEDEGDEGVVEAGVFDEKEGGEEEEGEHAEDGGEDCKVYSLGGAAVALGDWERAGEGEGNEGEDELEGA